mmetsp:Transcript_89942/g.140852  ORF Transcript_89942/g.140852 Transcript_89942/m.140852 type:complete len:876 (+) Transcript_89942:33-2660(+)
MGLYRSPTLLAPRKGRDFKNKTWGPVGADKVEFAHYVGGSESQLLLPALPSYACKQEEQFGRFGRLFLKHRNREFAESAELAVRGAVSVVLLGIPVVMRPGDCPFSFIDWLAGNPLYTNSVSLFVIYCLSKTTGETVHNISCAFFGVALAFADISVMATLFPGGVTETSCPMVFWLGLLNGIGFVALLLVLNLDVLTTIYACSEFVYWWMDFLELKTADYYSAFEDAMTTLTGCLVGCFFCFLATLLPYPLLAIWKAQNSAKELMSVLLLTWDDFTCYYCGDRANVYEQDRLARDLKGLQDSRATLAKHISNAWWECSFVTRWARARLMLKRLDQSLCEAYDRLFNAQLACLREGFEIEHMEMMAQLRPHIERVTAEAGMLLARCTDAASDGVITNTEEFDLKGRIQSTRNAAATLTNEFQAAKQRSGRKGIQQDIVDEHAFCFDVSVYGQIAIEYAEDLLADKSGSRPLESIAESLGVWKIFDLSVICSKKHVRYVIRNLVAILLTFWMGRSGLGHVIDKNDATMACIVAVFFNKVGGAALPKTLARIQGTVIGTVVGEIAFSYFGQCNWWSHFFLAICLLIWAFMSFFIYHHSKLHGNRYCGFLLAMFGAKYMLSPCSMDTYDGTPVYGKIVSVVFATSIKSILDAATTPERSADLAFAAFMKSWKSIANAVALLFDASVTCRSYQRSRLSDELAQAQLLSGEAADEPRYWRPVWKEGLFEQAIRSANNLRYGLSSVEYCVVGGGCTSRAMKSVFFVHLMQRQSFLGVKRLLMQKYEQVAKMFQLVYEVGEEGGPDPIDELEKNDPYAFDDYVSEWQDALGKFMIDADTLASKHEGTCGTLESDPNAQTSSLIVSMDSMMDELRSLQHAILRA